MRKIKWGLLFLIGFTCVLSFAIPEPVQHLDKDQRIEKASEAYQQARLHLKKMDYSAAFDLMKEAAELGLTEAERELEEMYEKGQGPDENLKEAFFWYEKAAAKGDMIALLQAGFIVEKGLIFDPDADKAKEYYKRAFENPPPGFDGDYKALSKRELTDLEKIWLEVIYRLGIVHEFPEKEAPDYGEAFKRYKQGADAGHARCQFRAARLLHHGTGVKQDIKKAEELYLEAALAGIVYAMEALIFIYKTQKKFTQARQWTLKAIEAGSIWSQIQLAFFLWNGLGGEKNVDEAWALLEEVIENPKTKSKDKREAQWMLGYFYSKGIGVEQDIKKAEELFLESARADFVPAMEGLLFIYNRQKKFEEARKWALEAIKKAGSIPSQI